MATLLPEGKQSFTNSAGAPLVGGRLYTYDAGTNNPRVTYQDAAGTLPNTNPVIMDARGEAVIFWAGSYKVELRDAANNLIWTVDNVSGISSSDLAGSAGAGMVGFLYAAVYAAGTIGKWLQDLATATGSLFIGFLHDGVGAVLRTLQARLRDTTTVKDFGAVGDGVTDDTAAFQAFLNYCYNTGDLGFIPRGVYIVSNISITVTGGRLTQGLRWNGAARNVTTIKQKAGAVGSLITFTNGSINNAPSSLQLELAHFTLQGVGKTQTGLFMDGVADNAIVDLTIDAFDIGIRWRNSLLSEVRRTAIANCNTGQKTEHSGAGSYCNAMKFDRVISAGCSSFAYDIGGSAQVVWDTCDTEQCGTVSPTSAITFTSGSSVIGWPAHGLSAGDPVIITTTGTLPTNFNPDQIYYVIPDGTNTIRLAATLVGADIVAGSAGAGVHTGLSPRTGGIVIRKDCIDEVGYGLMNMVNNWFESNEGATFRSEYMSSAIGFMLYIKGGHMLNSSNNPSIAIGNARYVSIEDHFNAVAADRVNISSDFLTIKNSLISFLVRPNVSKTVVLNSRLNSIDHSNGYKSSYTASLTGCTTVPTGTVTYVIQGEDVTLNIPDILGTSNTAAATLTGLPAELIPAFSRTLLLITRDNGVEKVSPGTIATGTGVITLNNAFSGVFTAAGTKGISALTVRYQK